MSADNILVILQKKNNAIAVYDVGFSQISVHESWSDSMNREDSNAVTNHILNNPYCREIKEFPRGSTIKDAVNFCKQYMSEDNVAEYGYVNIIRYF